MSLKENLGKLAEKVGGAAKTRHDRKVIAERLAGNLQTKNIQIKDIKFLKSKHIEDYINSRISEDKISLRTGQNEMASIRQILREAGLVKLANSERISNKVLGIGGASREGTKTAISNEVFRERLSVIDKIDNGVGACIMLGRLLGLRAEEAVQSVKSLKTWARALTNGVKIRVVYGTKGGRARDTHVVHVERAREVIQVAIECAKLNGGWLIAKSDLKAAMNRYHNVLKANGFVGKLSGHSIRYAFARERYNAYLKQGFTIKESLSMTSMDLGHGDGRGTYVKRTYLR